jgi:hypothetical protein
MRGYLASFALSLLSANFYAAQDSARLIELFSPNYQYRVSCRVAIEGALRLPPTKNQNVQTIKITGKSVIEYHECVLHLAQGKVDKTVRSVERMDFVRNVDGQEQKSQLRPEVRLLVIQRLQNLEVPFSPQGPLSWSEIDLVRTDVFTPALAGMLPRSPIRPGETWAADVEAVKELTDLDVIKKGGLNCKYEGTEPGNARLARVSFQGTINGVGEDGPAEHQLDGYYFFDLQSNHLSYLSLQGVHHPLGADGQPQGEIRGTFVLTRDPAGKSEALSEQALARYNLTPNDENTQLLFENSEVRFMYPRQWHVEEAGGRQVRLAEKQGSDLLITLDPPGKAPTAAQFQQEVFTGLTKQKGQLTRPLQNPETIQVGNGTIERFSAEARFGTQLAAFDYYVIRQQGGSATMSLRSVPAQAAQRQREADRIVKSMALRVK